MRCGLRLRQRHRLVVGAEEARHLRRILDQVIGLVGHFHLHQHIAGEEFSLGVDFAAAPDLDDLFLRNQNFLEQARQPALLGLLADRIRHLVLEIRVGVDGVPSARHVMNSGS